MKEKPRGYWDQCEFVTKTMSDTGKQDEEHREDIPSTSKCGSCEFVSDEDNDIKMHMTYSHTFFCNTCKLEFESQKKLESHMCRIHITNPACGDSYTKNWIISRGCTRVFSTFLKKEIVFLHCQQCIDGVNSCSDLMIVKW